MKHSHHEQLVGGMVVLITAGSFMVAGAKDGLQKLNERRKKRKAKVSNGS